MSKQNLKDKHGHAIGYIETNSHGIQTLKDNYGNSKGSYDPNTNTTRDKHGHTVGTGNLLASLL